MIIGLSWSHTIKIILDEFGHDYVSYKWVDTSPLYSGNLEVSERIENVTCPAAGLYMIPITGRNAMSEVIVYQVYAWWHVTVITSTSFDQCPPEAAGIKDTLLAV